MEWITGPDGNEVDIGKFVIYHRDIILLFVKFNLKPPKY